MEAIKPTDLRIGNWIASGKEFKSTSVIGRVRSIGNEDCEFEQIEVETQEDFTWFFAGDYCGIPLTEDILVRAGFKFNKLDKCFKLFPCFEVQIIADVYENNALLMLYTRTAHTDYKPIYKVIDTVHQLQNLYYSLTNEELNIQL